MYFRRLLLLKGRSDCLSVDFKKPLLVSCRGYTLPSGTPGAGAGKGGGGGGSIKEAGGGLGKYGAAQEEGYFFNKDRDALKKLKAKEGEKLKETKQKPEDAYSGPVPLKPSGSLVQTNEPGCLTIEKGKLVSIGQAKGYVEKKDDDEEPVPKAEEEEDIDTEKKKDRKSMEKQEELKRKPEPKPDATD